MSSTNYNDPSDEIEGTFPELRASDWRVASSEDETYNCIAFAANDQERWWWPPGAPDAPTFWPRTAPRDTSPLAFITAFAELGYEECPSDEVECGFEKVAIYVDTRGEVQHMARQVASGAWVSKLGRGNDIVHSQARDLNSPLYGDAQVFLKRSTSG